MWANWVEALGFLKSMQGPLGRNRVEQVGTQVELEEQHENSHLQARSARESVEGCKKKNCYLIAILNLPLRPWIGKQAALMPQCSS